MIKVQSKIQIMGKEYTVFQLVVLIIVSIGLVYSMGVVSLFPW